MAMPSEPFPDGGPNIPLALAKEIFTQLLTESFKHANNNTCPCPPINDRGRYDAAIIGGVMTAVVAILVLLSFCCLGLAYDTRREHEKSMDKLLHIIFMKHLVTDEARHIPAAGQTAGQATTLATTPAFGQAADPTAVHTA